jgi:methyl-accepting chemotaxis protein
VIGICVLAVALLFGAVVRQAWTSNSVVQLEADGAAMMHPTTTLLYELVGAQSSAVRGERVNPEPVREALNQLTELNAQVGVALKTNQRLTDLTSQVESAFARAETGRAAYNTYSTLVNLALEMIRRIGDSAHLVHDPDLDSYYLMDAALVRLPDAMVYAGRASDLVTLAGGEKLSGEDQVRAAVARFGVSYDAERVAAGLTTSVDFTSRSELGTNITERFDTFRAAADAFAPPTMLQELASTVDAATMAANARRVYAAANSLAHRLLAELQALLDNRSRNLAEQQRFTAIASVVVILIGFVMLWLLIAGRPRRRPAPRFGTPPTESVAVGSLAYAREMLNPDELVTAGRSPRRGNGNAL